MITVEACSLRGHHAVNEDAHAVKVHPQDDRVWLCALADGQGGRSGGAPAAQRACLSSIETLISFSPRRLSAQPTWPTALRQVDEAVRLDEEAGFTTLVACAILGDTVVGASSGDSALLLIDGSGQALELTARQHKNPPVGSGMAVFVPFAARLSEPWRVLAMSDGVWKYTGWPGVIELARRESGQALITSLVEQVRQNSGDTLPDDCTVVVLEGKP